MEYNNNKVIDLLKRNSKLTPEESESTNSVYYYWKNYSFRYSDHRTTSEKSGRYNIIYYYSLNGFLIKEPRSKDYTFLTESEACAYLRRLEKKDKKSMKIWKKDAQKRKLSVINQKLKRIRKGKKYKKIEIEEED